MSVLERNCVLLFDEIIIRSDLTYNRVRDIIDGFVDFKNLLEILNNYIAALKSIGLDIKALVCD